MRRIYSPPAYTGLNRIAELKEMGGRRGNRHPNPSKLTKTLMAFNSAGYADELTKGMRNLIIDRNIDGRLVAYAGAGNDFRELIGFKDPELAQNIINELYTSPYYHSTRYYQMRLARIQKSIDMYSCDNIEQLRGKLYEVYLEAKEIEEAIKQGCRIFGCKHRYMTINHLCVGAMNRYLTNFTKTKLVLDKPQPIVYDGVASGDFIRHYNLVETSKDDIVITNDSMFGPRIDPLGLSYLIESDALNLINSFSLIQDPNVVDKMRVVYWMMKERGVFSDGNSRKEFVKRVFSDMGYDKRIKVFNETYVEYMRKAGYTVKQA